MGVSGRIIVEIIIRGGRQIICLVVLKCHLILVVFVVGNMVKDVAYVRRI